MKKYITEKNFMWLAIIACAVLSLTKAFHKGRQVERKRMAPIQKHWDQEERGMKIERQKRMKQRGNSKQNKAAKGLGESPMMQFYRSQESNEHTEANQPKFGSHDFFLGKDKELWDK